MGAFLHNKKNYRRQKCSLEGIEGTVRRALGSTPGHAAVKERVGYNYQKD